jgi:hypothetical protein|tara:strand:- start:236 stop:463 length:228 start_codon:yes stop_codon:yes gene_type:complete
MKKSVWTTEFAIYTKGQDFTCEYFKNGFTKEVNGVIDYVMQNRYYSLIVLTNGFEYTQWTKLWLKLSNDAKINKI